MHPALSIIVFSTLTGLGYGLAVALAWGALDPASPAGRAGYALALLLAAAGLVSSTFHLGHKERAWRALSQWRSSWLSREGVAALLAFGPLGLAALGAVVFGEDWRTFGVLGAALALVTVFCTAMIYGSLKTVAHWHTWLTPLVYIAFSLAGGLLAAAALRATFGTLSPALCLAASLALVLAWALKALWWWRARRVRSTSTPESATGLGNLGRVRLLERPHVTENYLTREMGFQVARRHAAKLRRIAVGAGAVLPALALLAALFAPPPIAGPALVAGLLAHVLGVLVERWLFFAEARHTVTLYYGAVAA